MNQTTIIGNLTADPKSRTVETANGQQLICNFTVAVNRARGGQETADFFRVACWRKQAENAMKYLKKGSKVCVMGPVSVRAYLSNDGQACASLEVTAENIEYLNSRAQNGGETDE